jgi:hypothetical protein
MGIIPPTLRDIREHDRVLLRLLAERAHEWQRQKGIHRLMARIKVALWAWSQTARERRRLHDKNAPYRIG